ncbi:6945_t:CDS:2 [Diversispora eburnea]|uniref:Proteasome subunit beta n=1 Tax=Diversispora eburnea TaxID=1213867 RepID=A0A9N9AWL1_9GLOM|nr:6945_t:CDS:2 [Diversispora eburnea]
MPDPGSYNGGAVVAMTGKNCVAIASDKRIGIQMQTIGFEFSKVFPVTDKSYVGLPGLATDTQTLYANMYKLREEREIEPRTLSNMIASTLYEKRWGPFFVEPLVAGLDKNNQPFICGMDSIGCSTETCDFVVGGTSQENLYGICENEPEDLFETISQSLLCAVDRDCLAGWGAVVHVITPERVITRTLKARMD